jgi:hypothetical protein
MDPRSLIHLLTRTAAAYRVALTELELDVYVDALGHLDDITLRAALQRYGQGGRSFFPTVPEILKAASDIDAVRSNQPSTLDAWGDLRKKISRVNLDIMGRQPEYEATRLGITPLDSQIVRRLGGWAHLGMMPPKDLDWKAKEFAQVYAECVERQRTEDQLVALAPARGARVPLLAEGE